MLLANESQFRLTEAVDETGGERVNVAEKPEWTRSAPRCDDRFVGPQPNLDVRQAGGIGEIPKEF